MQKGISPKNTSSIATWAFGKKKHRRQYIFLPQHWGVYCGGLVILITIFLGASYAAQHVLNIFGFSLWDVTITEGVQCSRARGAHCEEICLKIFVMLTIVLGDKMVRMGYGMAKEKRRVFFSTLNYCLTIKDELTLPSRRIYFVLWRQCCLFVELRHWSSEDRQPLNSSDTFLGGFSFHIVFNRGRSGTHVQ